MFESAGRASASWGSSSQLRHAAVRWSGKIWRARANDASQSAGRERAGLGDVHAEDAVAVVLELQSPELGDPAAPHDLDPLHIRERLFAANIVGSEDVAQRRPRFVVGQPERSVLRADIREPRGEMIREH